MTSKAISSRAMANGDARRPAKLHSDRYRACGRTISRIPRYSTEGTASTQTQLQYNLAYFCSGLRTSIRAGQGSRQPGSEKDLANPRPSGIASTHARSRLHRLHRSSPEIEGPPHRTLSRQISMRVRGRSFGREVREVREVRTRYGGARPKSDVLSFSSSCPPSAATFTLPVLLAR
ncbi:hypothetical protein N431DRAFT_47028 [Stipitochalara longipes BDJ]|nr:hypothetical protein N431DRAFT_47028 [Stipitochalara longipes BDJ]